MRQENTARSAHAEYVSMHATLMAASQQVHCGTRRSGHSRLECACAAASLSPTDGPTDVKVLLVVDGSVYCDLATPTVVRLSVEALCA